VPPTEIEHVLVSHPDVADGGVFKDFNGLVSAAVELKNGAKYTQVSCEIL